MTDDILNHTNCSSNWTELIQGKKGVYVFRKGQKAVARKKFTKQEMRDFIRKYSPNADSASALLEVYTDS